MKTPMQYWQKDGAQWPMLQLIAVKLFSMATSSAASERNFSTLGFIHTKARNKLNSETIEKVTYIKSNHMASQGHNPPTESTEEASEDSNNPKSMLDFFEMLDEYTSNGDFVISD
jgi:hAT family C-terminal dimerisation region